MDGYPLRKYTAKELQKAVDEYFASEPEGEPYTIMGLELFLDIDSNTLERYESGEGYEELWGIVKKAKRKIERQWVNGAMKQRFNPVFCIFALKNCFGWRDKQDLEVSGTVPNESQTEYTTKSDEEVTRLLAERRKRMSGYRPPVAAN